MKNRLFKDKRNFKKSHPLHNFYQKMLEKTYGRPEEYVWSDEEKEEFGKYL